MASARDFADDRSTSGPEDAHEFYVRALTILREARVPFLVGGAWALAHYTGIDRDTKDFDLFLRPGDVEGALRALEERGGYRTEITFRHWLGKVFGGPYLVDLIYSSGNGVARVDEEWFEHAVEAEVLGLAVQLTPPEEMLWSKAFIMERERYDGADVAHLLHSRAASLDWPRLLRRFGPYWRLLYAHLVLFGFIYPGERSAVPEDVMRDLAARLSDEVHFGNGPERVCQGTLISRQQFLTDLERWGYRDARTGPGGSMSQPDIDAWTAAIENPHGEKPGVHSPRT